MKKLPTLLIIFIFIGIVYSFAEERIVLTTYYPAPYGVYKEMRADQMTIGSTYRNVPVTNGRLLISGSIGIGTTNPQAQIEVGDASDWLRINTVNVSNYSEIAWGDDASDRLRFFYDYWDGTSSDKEVMTLLSSGNVGIGTISPDTPLTFPGSVGQKIHLYGTQADGYVLGVESNDLRIAGGTGGSDRITFRTGGYYNGTERMRIASNGFVGIGTTAPSSMLHIAGAGGSLRIERNFGFLGGMNLEFPSGYPTIYSDAGQQLRFGVNGSSSPVVTITSDGKTIIGTAGSTSYKLDVGGNTAIRGAINTGSDTSDASIELGYLGSGNRYAYVDFHGDAINPDYGLRIIRNNSGQNASSGILHKGTGNLVIATESAAPILFNTNNTTRVTIAANGDVSGLEAVATTTCNEYDIASSGARWLCAADEIVTNIYTNGGDFGGGDRVRCCKAIAK